MQTVQSMQTAYELATEASWMSGLDESATDWDAEIQNGFDSFGEVPYVGISRFGMAVLKTMTVQEAVEDALSNEPVIKKLMEVFKTSTCPQVKDLYSMIAVRYIDSRAADLADLEF